MMDETKADRAEAPGRTAADAAAGASSQEGGRNRTDPPAAETQDTATLRAQLDEYYDLLLRKTAEFDNYRKRIERERREFVEFAAADLLTELLPLVDDLERALKAADTDALDAYRQGVELIHRQLVELLRKRGVVPIEALGTDFDPHLHQAVTREISDAHRDGEVTEELQRGYRLGERLLRPSMVKVATRE